MGTSMQVMLHIRFLRPLGCVVLLLLALLPRGLSPPAPTGIDWTIEIADGEGGAGRYPSIALTPGGWPAIAYQFANTQLRYTWRDASGWHNVTLDQPASGGSGHRASLAMDHNGIPHIGYVVWNITGQHVWHAYWNASSFMWEKELAAEAGEGLALTMISLALESTGIPHIAYLHSETGELMYASRASTWGSETVAVVGCCRAVSLKLDSLDNPHIAAYNYTLPGLEYYWNEAGTWLRETVEVNGSIGSFGISLALNSGDRPRIAYIVGVPGVNLKYANRTATMWSITTVPTTLDVQCTVSLALGPLDQPRIAYTGGIEGYSLKYTYRNRGIWHTVIIDRDFPYGYASMAYDPSGVAHIAYYRRPPAPLLGQLKYAKGVPFNDPPTSSLLPVNPYWWTTGSLPVRATASDPDSTVVQVDLYYRFDGGAGWGSWTLFGSDLAPPWSWSFPFPDGEGWYEFFSLAFDGMDWETNKTTAETEAGYDATPPVSSALPISPYWHEAPAVVDATASDTLSGVADVTLEYAYSPDDFTWGPWTTFGTLTALPWSWTFSFPDGEGHYEFHTIADDVAGNVETSKDYAEAAAGYRVLPDYIPTSPTPSSPVAVGLSESVQLTLHVQNLGGSANETSSLAFYNASTPLSPFSVLTVPAVAKNGIVGPFEVNWSSPASPCACTVTAHMDYYDDIAESNETNNTYTWTLNVVPGPITSLVIGSPNYTSTVMYVKSSTPLDFSVADQSGTGIRYTNYSIDGGTWNNYTATGTFYLAGEGEHAIDWYSEDYAGNVESITSIVLRVDDTPPATNMLIGDPKYLVGGNFVNYSTLLILQATDGGAMPVGLDRTECRIDGGSWMTYSSPLLLTSEDAHTIDYHSHDLLMNTETIRSLQVIVDNTPPATSRSVGEPKHQAAQLFVKSTTAINLTSADGGVTPVGLAAVEYRVDGGIWETYSSNITLKGSDGLHMVYYMSRDLLGNDEIPKSLTVFLDNTPPATAISPDTGDLDVTTLFTLTATDGGSGVKVTRYRIDGGIWADYSDGFTIPEGDHNISHQSVDNLDNIEREKWLAVTVQAPPPANTPPSVILHTPIGGEEWFKGSVHTINWTMHDDQDADDNLTVYVNYTTGGTTASVVAAVKGGESFLWTLPDIEAADIVVNITVIDTGGLKAWDQSGSFTIKAPPPPPEVVANYKPIVALVFAIILAVVGTWSSKKRPWKGRTERRTVMKAFTFTSIPFVLAESATGILSLSFEPLRIPPLIGWGTAIDILILVAGVLFSLLRLARKGGGGVEPQGTNAKQQSR